MDDYNKFHFVNLSNAKMIKKLKLERKDKELKLIPGMLFKIQANSALMIDQRTKPYAEIAKSPIA